MKVLVNTPDLELSGGVADYYITIKPHFISQVTYFSIGKRKKCRGKLDAFWQIIKDYYNFFVTINSTNYDVIHINPSLGSRSFIRDALFVLLAKLSRKRVIVFFHGWDEEFAAFSEKYLLWLYKMTYFRVDSIIVLAKQFEKKITSLNYNGKTYVETTIVSDEVFNEFSVEDRNYENNIIDILFLSRLEKEKGIYELIEAVEILNSTYNNIKLTVAGDGDEREALEQFAKKCNVGNIIFTGHITGKDKQQVFEDADIFVFPTYYGEGMPLSVLEAMAYGLPVITRPVGGLNDFFENEKMGFLIEEKDPYVISDRIEKIINNKELRIKMSKYNRIYAESRFKASNVASRLEDIYMSVLD